MLYGFQDGNDVFVVAAAESVQFEVFKTGVAEDLGATLVSGFDIMMNPDRYKGFSSALVFEFSSPEAAQALIDKIGLNVVSRPQAVDFQAKMIAQEAVDPFDPSNKRTIEEIYNIEGEDDTWDTRTEDEKARAALLINLDAIRAKQDAGELTTESFAMREGKNGLANVTAIDAHFDDDGNLVIDGVTAEKGLIQHAEDEFSLDGAEGADTANAPRPWLPDYDASRFINDVSNPDAFKGIEATEMVFAVSGGDPYGTGVQTAYVRMAPKAFFDANSTLYENSLWPMVRHLIARDSVEHDENTFGHPNMTIEEARAIYTARGFVEDQAFTDHLNAEIDKRAEKAKGKGKTPKNEGRFADVSTPADASQTRDVKFGQGPEFTDEAEAAAAASAAEEEDAYSGPVEFTLEDDADVTFLSRYLKAINEDSDAIIAKLAAGNGKVFEIDDHRVAALLAISFRRRGIGFKAQCDGEDYEVDDHSTQYIQKGPIAIFYKVELPWARLDEVYDAITAAGLEYQKVVMASGESMDGAWVACPVQRVAERVEAAIVAACPTQDTDIYTINPSGERLVPKGANAVVTTGANEREIGPRPWNADAHKLPGLTEEEIVENDRNLKGDEFLFTGHDETRGCTIYVTPRTFFDDNGEMWDGELPDAAKRHLPRDFKEVEGQPGAYTSSMRKYQQVVAELSKRGMVESMKLRMHLN